MILVICILSLTAFIVMAAVGFAVYASVKSSCAICDLNLGDICEDCKETEQ